MFGNLKIDYSVRSYTRYCQRHNIHYIQSDMRVTQCSTANTSILFYLRNYTENIQPKRLLESLDIFYASRRLRRDHADQLLHALVLAQELEEPTNDNDNNDNDENCERKSSLREKPHLMPCAIF